MANNCLVVKVNAQVNNLKERLGYLNLKYPGASRILLGSIAYGELRCFDGNLYANSGYTTLRDNPYTAPYMGDVYSPSSNLYLKKGSNVQIVGNVDGGSRLYDAVVDLNQFQYFGSVCGFRGSGNVKGDLEVISNIPGWKYLGFSQPCSIKGDVKFLAPILHRLNANTGSYSQVINSKYIYGELNELLAELQEFDDWNPNITMRFELPHANITRGGVEPGTRVFFLDTDAEGNISLR